MNATELGHAMSLDANKPTAQQPPLVSIVIPMLNERAGLRPLFERLSLALKLTPVEWEIVIVDDGSTDGTRDVIIGELSRFSRWKLALLSRNFGQQPAYFAGLEQACGDAVVFLDADLQDPPELIAQLLAKWREGFKVVTGCRISREEQGLRRVLLDSFHWLFHRLTGRLMPMNSGMFSLVDRVVVNHLIAAREKNLFLPALKCWYGFPQSSIRYARSVRAAGEPKQSFRKLFRYALDGLFSFSDLPLQWIAAIGAIISVISFGYAFLLVLIKCLQFAGHLTSLDVRGFTTLAVAIFCLSGIQLLSLGILGQYLAQIYREIKGRPLYIVEAVLTSDEPGRI
jgi:polyisoprenyl-phosphate glycosyltransferase